MSEHQETLFFLLFELDVRLITGAGFWGWLWSLPSWRFSKAAWIWSWLSVCMWPWLNRTLPNSAILWFCDGMTCQDGSILMFSEFWLLLITNTSEVPWFSEYRDNEIIWQGTLTLSSSYVWLFFFFLSLENFDVEFRCILCCGFLVFFWLLLCFGFF